ncbi:MAG: acetate uptake transporter, partial [Solirubrobacteraceae bacterium]
ISPAVMPIVFAVALMFGGITQFIAGLIQIRSGKSFAGMVFAGFGAFWMSLFAYAEWFARTVPPAQAGHALGLLLYAFGIFGVVILVTSLRSNVFIVVITVFVVSSLFLCAAGSYGAHPTLTHWGGYTGLIVAALVFYLALAELCEIVYERTVLPIWPLSKA